MMDLVWWHWGVVGLLFMAAELMLPSFILIWFGFGALLVMIIMLIVPDMSLTYQILGWSITSLLMIFLWFKFFKNRINLVGRAAANIEGEVGILTEAVAPFKKGKVRFQRPLVGSDLWDCVADEEIEVGTRVKVSRVEGSLLTVEKTNH